MAEHVPPMPVSVVSYASAHSAASPLWKLLRLGLILWASITLFRHVFYWTNVLMLDGFVGLPPYRTVGFTFVECVLLIIFLIAAIGSPRGTRARFRLLGGLGIALVTVVVVGGFVDMALNAPASFRTMSAGMRTVWSFIARIQILVIPLLCVIGMFRGIQEE